MNPRRALRSSPYTFFRSPSRKVGSRLPSRSSITLSRSRLLQVFSREVGQIQPTKQTGLGSNLRQQQIEAMLIVAMRCRPVCFPNTLFFGQGSNFLFENLYFVSVCRCQLVGLF